MQVREFRQTVQYRENASLPETNSNRYHYTPHSSNRHNLSSEKVQINENRESENEINPPASENDGRIFSSKKSFKKSFKLSSVENKVLISLRPANSPRTDYLGRSNASLDRRRRESDRVRAVLRLIWDHVVEAFCFLASDGGDTLSRPELRRGLRELGLEDVDVDRLLVEAGGDESVETGTISLWQFVRQLGWKRGGLGSSVREVAVLRDQLRVDGMNAIQARAHTWNARRAADGSASADTIKGSKIYTCEESDRMLHSSARIDPKLESGISFDSKSRVRDIGADEQLSALRERHRRLLSKAKVPALGPASCSNDATVSDLGQSALPHPPQPRSGAALPPAAFTAAGLPSVIAAEQPSETQGVMSRDEERQSESRRRIHPNDMQRGDAGWAAASVLRHLETDRRSFDRACGGAGAQQVDLEGFLALLKQAGVLPALISDNDAALCFCGAARFSEKMAEQAEDGAGEDMTPTISFEAYRRCMAGLAQVAAHRGRGLARHPEGHVGGGRAAGTARGAGGTEREAGGRSGTGCGGLGSSHAEGGRQQAADGGSGLVGLGDPGFTRSGGSGLLGSPFLEGGDEGVGGVGAGKVGTRGGSMWDWPESPIAEYGSEGSSDCGREASCDRVGTGPEAGMRGRDRDSRECGSTDGGTEPGMSAGAGGDTGAESGVLGIGRALFAEAVGEADVFERFAAATAGCAACGCGWRLGSPESRTCGGRGEGDWEGTTGDGGGADGDGGRAGRGRGEGRMEVSGFMGALLETGVLVRAAPPAQAALAYRSACGGGPGLSHAGFLDALRRLWTLSAAAHPSARAPAPHHAGRSQARLAAAVQDCGTVSGDAPRSLPALGGHGSLASTAEQGTQKLQSMAAAEPHPSGPGGLLAAAWEYQRRQLRAALRERDRYRRLVRAGMAHAEAAAARSLDAQHAAAVATQEAASLRTALAAAAASAAAEERAGMLLKDRLKLLEQAQRPPAARAGMEPSLARLPAAHAGQTQHGSQRPPAALCAPAARPGSAGRGLECANNAAGGAGPWDGGARLYLGWAGDEVGRRGGEESGSWDWVDDVRRMPYVEVGAAAERGGSGPEERGVESGSRRRGCVEGGGVEAGRGLAQRAQALEFGAALIEELMGGEGWGMAGGDVRGDAGSGQSGEAVERVAWDGGDWGVGSGAVRPVHGGHGDGMADCCGGAGGQGEMGTEGRDERRGLGFGDARRRNAGDGAVALRREELVGDGEDWLESVAVTVKELRGGPAEPPAGLSARAPGAGPGPAGVSGGAGEQARWRRRWAQAAAAAEAARQDARQGWAAAAAALEIGEAAAAEAEAAHAVLQMRQVRLGCAAQGSRLPPCDRHY